jgi:two-component system, response regulator RegA
MPGDRLARVLVVEDDPSLMRSLQGALAARCLELRACTTVAEARGAAGWRADLVICDVVLPDGDAFDVLDALAGAPAPPVVAISGEAGPDQSFELSQRGVRAFLAKPFSLDGLDRAIDRALATAPELAPIARQVVGKRGLHEVEDELREVMIDQAMAQSGGSRRAAARLLGISRQLLQHALRRRR